MKKLKIISEPNKSGGFTGFLKDNPSVKAVGANQVELVQNLIDLAKDNNKKEKRKI